jgi:polyphenol oxidase
VSASAGSPGIECLTPDWPTPHGVRTAFTLRRGGVSQPPYDSLNLGMHVGDDPAAVAENRRRLAGQLGLPGAPCWLEQVHGTDVCDLDMTAAAVPAPADAAFTRRRGSVAVVQVADCLPVLLAASDGSAVAVAHAGWRGLAAGVVEAAIAKLGLDPGRLLAWLGPAIGPGHFEVGAEVRDAFLTHDAEASAAFQPNPRGRWQCDLAALARQRLADCGVRAVFGGRWCTYADAAGFFSYRRDRQCGRMAALIWRV